MPIYLFADWSRDFFNLFLERKVAVWILVLYPVNTIERIMTSRICHLWDMTPEEGGLLNGKENNGFTK